MQPDCWLVGAGESGGQQQLISDLTAQLDQMALERDAAVEKLTGIQQLMFG